VDGRDAADVVVAMLTTVDHDHQIDVLAGPDALTCTEMAHQLSTSIGPRWPITSPLDACGSGESAAQFLFHPLIEYSGTSGCIACVMATVPAELTRIEERGSILALSAYAAVRRRTMVPVHTNGASTHQQNGWHFEHLSVYPS
jgi:hypothetical protein